MSADIEIRSDAGVQVLRINRPDKKNALTGKMYAALSDALEAGDKSDDVAVHVITGTDGLFTAGNDIGEFQSFVAGGSEFADDVTRFLRVLPRVKKPLIAAVDGAAIGIGTTLLFHCDLVYATERSTFSTPFLNLGLVPEAASSLLMPACMGYARSFEMLVLGETFDAQRMVVAGVVNRIVGVEELEPVATGAARQLAAKPPQALQSARKLMRHGADAVAARVDEELVAFMKCLKSPEAAEAFQAFVEKRPADFSKLRQR